MDSQQPGRTDKEAPKYLVELQGLPSAAIGLVLVGGLHALGVPFDDALFWAAVTFAAAVSMSAFLIRRVTRSSRGEQVLFFGLIVEMLVLPELIGFPGTDVDVILVVGYSLSTTGILYWLDDVISHDSSGSD